MSDLFRTPELLGWGLAVPLAMWLALIGLDRVRTRRLVAWTAARGAAIAPDLGVRRRRWRRRLFVAGLFFALLAAADPAWGVDRRVTENRTHDVVVCLDVSRSMLAGDVAPTRLGRAQEELRVLSDRAAGDRFGLVVFAGVARLSVPLTRDLRSFADLVDVADPLAVELGGTDLGAALDTALEALDSRGASEGGVVLVISDGEDHEQRGLQAARACAERGVVVHCMGIGSRIGSKIALPTEDGGSAFLRAAAGTGDEVVSVMNADGLRAIADATGGAFVDAATSTRPLVALYEQEIVARAAESRADASAADRASRYQWPLLLGLLLLLVELSTTDRRVRGGER